MFKKIIHFVKYHNAFTIGLAFVLLATAGAFANDDVRDTVLGQEIITEQGIDNSQVLAADLANFDFRLTIQNVREDEQNYYVDYTYETLGILDNRWQPLFRQQTLTVSKNALASRDLGLYVAEELGEVIDYQLAYLKEVQTLEKEKGQTKIVQTTDYTGLIGLVLNPVTKELPGYEPVVKPPEIVTQPTPESSQQPRVESEVPPVSCQPNWQCSQWQPSASTVLAGEQFVQTRTCQDLAGCGMNEDKLPETQTAIGTYVSPTSGSSGGGDTGNGFGAATSTYYFDADTDGYGNPNNFVEAISTPEGYVENSADCDDTNAKINPFATEICDGKDNNCDGNIDENPETLCRAENANGICQVGSCNFTCLEGFSNYDNDWSNGCETTTTTDTELNPIPEPSPTP